MASLINVAQVVRKHKQVSGAGRGIEGEGDFK